MWTRLRETICRPRTSGPTCCSTGRSFSIPSTSTSRSSSRTGWSRRASATTSALIGNGRRRTYKELADWTNRLAHALAEDFGVKPGNRVLIRSGNNPAMVAVWLAVTKAGGVAVNTMPLLRAGELTAIVDKAEIGLALCDNRIADELVAAARGSRFLKSVVGFDGTSNHDAELDRVALNKPVRFDAVRTGTRRRGAPRASRPAPPASPRPPPTSTATC